MVHQKQKSKKNIVILGAGFCGIRCAKNLQHLLKGNEDYRVILIDKNSVHTYFTDLYEVGTAFNPIITDSCLKEIKDSVCIKINNIFERESVFFCQKRVKKINYAKNEVIFADKSKLKFDFLVVALGSVPNFYNIPGLKENSFTFKTIQDAIKLDCYLDEYFKFRSKNERALNVNIVIGGGGCTGVEFGSELRGYLKRLAKKYDFNHRDVYIIIVEVCKELLTLGEDMSQIVINRLKKLRIVPMLKTRITCFDGKKLFLKDENNQKKIIKTDILVWTGGIRANNLLESFPKLTLNGELEVNSYLEAIHYPRVYAGGDNALIINPENKYPVPKLAQLAIQEGKSIAWNIFAEITHQERKNFKPIFKGFIIPLGGKFCVLQKGKLILKGILPFIIRRLIDLRYYLSIMSPRSAIKKWIHGSNIFLQND